MLFLKLSFLGGGGKYNVYLTYPSRGLLREMFRNCDLNTSKSIREVTSEVIYCTSRYGELNAEDKI